MDFEKFVKTFWPEVVPEKLIEWEKVIKCDGLTSKDPPLPLVQKDFVLELIRTETLQKILEARMKDLCERLGIPVLVLGEKINVDASKNNAAVEEVTEDCSKPYIAFAEQEQI